MAARQYAFKKEAQKAILGEREDLVSAEGFWIKPRKYSVHGSAEINDAVLSSTDLPEEVLTEVTEIIEREGLDATTATKEIIKFLSPRGKTLLIQSQSKANATSEEVIRLTLLHGIGQHNFFEDEESSSVVDDDLVDNLLEYKEISEECVQIIRAHNSPLAVEPEEISEMLSNGSTTESMSEAKTDLLTIAEDG